VRVCVCVRGVGDVVGWVEERERELGVSVCELVCVFEFVWCLRA